MKGLKFLRKHLLNLFSYTHNARVTSSRLGMRHHNKRGRGNIVKKCIDRDPSPCFKTDLKDFDLRSAGGDNVEQYFTECEVPCSLVETYLHFSKASSRAIKKRKLMIYKKAHLLGISRVEAGSNTSTVVLRLVGGDKTGTQCLGV
jgi:hypothetical protein